VIPEIKRIAREIVDLRDLDEALFKHLFDPSHIEMMTLDQLKESVAQVCNEQFRMAPEEVESMFKKVTRSQRTTGVHISMSKLTEKVFKAFDAHLINMMRDHVSKSVKPLQELFAAQDTKRVGALEYQQLALLL
jgi:5'-deoxynucleotidase YfbR-like HD superfamily hydrolase